MGNNFEQTRDSERSKSMTPRRVTRGGVKSDPSSISIRGLRAHDSLTTISESGTLYVPKRSKLLPRLRGISLRFVCKLLTKLFCQILFSRKFWGSRSIAMDIFTSKNGESTLNPTLTGV